MKFIEDALSGLLNPYSQLVIPVGTNIHTFRGISVVQDVGDIVFDEMDVDFADFDFDGDGRKESCSGNTTIATDADGTVHPICMRVWANGKPAMAAVFTEYPTKTNPGAGRMMGINLSNGVFLFPEGAFLGINYDEHDPSTSKSMEILTREEDPAGFRIHMALDQQGPEATSIKTFKASLTGGKIGTDKVQGVVRFKEDDHFLSGSLQFDPARSGEPNVSDQCVDLLTGDAPDPSNPSDNSQCVNLGIDVGAIPFLDFPDEREVFLPADFPSSPPSP